MPIHRWRPRFTIGGLMNAVAASAVALVVLSWAFETLGSRPAASVIALEWLPMGAILGADAYFLVRRARAGRSPFSPNFRLPTFARDLWLVLVCLYLPFLWVAMPSQWTLQTTYDLLAVPGLPGLVGILPLLFLVPQWTIFNGAVMVLTSILILMGLIRLTIRGWLGWTCALALAVGVAMSFLARLLQSL